MNSPNKEGDFHESANFPDCERWGGGGGYDCRGALAAQSSAVRPSPTQQRPPLSAKGHLPRPRRRGATPDLQGTWTSDDTWGVPFERPKNFGTRATLTEDELKARQKNVQQSEEFVDTGGANHSPAVAELKPKKRARRRLAPAAGTIRPWSGRCSGSRTLGRVCAPGIASDFADCGSAGWTASCVDARGAGQAGRQDEAAARSDSGVLDELELL